MSQKYTAERSSQNQRVLDIKCFRTDISFLTELLARDGKRNSINAVKCCDKAKEIVRNKNDQKSSEFPFL